MAYSLGRVTPLYGHVNELFALCCDHEGKLVASSCKAQSAPVAEIWLWQVRSWKSVGRLQSHSLTVTQMEFSLTITSISWLFQDIYAFSVFQINHKGTDEINYQIVTKQEAHKRIIWSCSWNPFDHEFATSSRDKIVKIWAVETESSVKLLLTYPPFKSSVTALSWLGLDNHNRGLLALGMENGLIELWNVDSRVIDGHLLVQNASVAVKFDPFLCHVSTVQQLSW